MGPFPHSSPDNLQRAAAAAGADEGVTPDTKYTKSEVNYRDAGSSNTRCEKCRHFRFGGQRGKGSCEIVNGAIDATYVCDQFEAGGSSLMDLVTGEPTQ